jgi:signal transduction histidine kinase
MKTTRTLPIRVWIGLTLLAVVAVPVLAMFAVAAHSVSRAATPIPNVTQYRKELIDNAANWNDPAWQQAEGSRLQAAGVGVVLYNTAGQIVFRSDAGMPGASPVMESASGPLPPLPGQKDVTFVYTGQARPVTAIRLTDGNTVMGTALLSSGAPATAFAVRTIEPNIFQTWLLQLAGPSSLRIALTGLVTLVVTAVIAAWFLGRALLRPLAATSRAARQIAAGDLDFTLPASHVREVAEVGAAFRAMGDALRASLERQEASDAERRFLITAIAHDLRTPLFALRGYLEGLAKGIATTPEKTGRYLGICQEKAAALERLIADLFTFTRVEYVDDTPRREPIDPGALLRHAVESMQPRAEEKGIHLLLDGTDTACPAEADGHLLVRAVENLLDNALRHTPEGGTITVRWERDAAGLTFTVADTGPGIPPPDLPHLFTPLFRGETSRNRRTGGAGLGLTIAQRILKAHGGTLSAANHPGGGAIFTATLPATSIPADNRREAGLHPVPEAALA